MQDLRLIEIELFNTCNRKCSWCPNKNIQSRAPGSLQFINPYILRYIRQELKKQNYNGYISFSRYNEPLLNPYSYTRNILRLFKKSVPNATLVFNTNGDYLNKKVLQEIPVDELSIMDYDNRGMDWCLNRLKKLNCIIDKIEEYFIYAHYNNIKILYYVDWQKHHLITNRGGNLPEYETIQRNRPCYEPLHFIGINYDGTVSPCCNIRNDIENQKPYIIGDLNTQTLEEILNSNKRKEFQKIAINIEKGTPCEFCLNQGGRYTREKGDINYG